MTAKDWVYFMQTFHDIYPDEGISDEMAENTLYHMNCSEETKAALWQIAKKEEKRYGNENPFNSGLIGKSMTSTIRQYKRDFY